MASPRDDFATFGPWIDVVRSVADVPRLYRPHPLDFSATRLVLKVPRNIDRRDAHPAMDLYDHLLIVDDTSVTCLSRSPEGYVTSRIAHDELAVLVDTVELLDGVFELHGTNGTTLRVPYNGASRDSIRTLSDTIRQLAGPKTLGAAMASHRTGIRPADLGASERGLVIEYLSATSSRSDTRLIAAHEGKRIYRRSGVIAGFVDRLRPTRVQGAILAATPSELIAHTRRDDIIKTTKPDHSDSRRTLLIDRLTGVRVVPHPVYRGVSEAQLSFGHAQYIMVVPTGSETERVLDALDSNL